jgi:hypothetical protein
MIIFPGEATFGYVEQAKENKTNNRVYALKFTATPKKVHFFWMQEPESQREKDKELADKVNALINGESTAASGGIGQMDQAQLMAMLTRAHTTPSAAESESPAAPSAGAQENATPSAGENQTGAGAEAGAAPAGAGEVQEAADSDKMNVDEEAKP